MPGRLEEADPSVRQRGMEVLETHEQLNYYLILGWKLGLKGAKYF
jgi:hypothetical protein